MDQSYCSIKIKSVFFQIKQNWRAFFVEIRRKKAELFELSDMIGPFWYGL